MAEAPSAALLTAMTTEHFVLQTAAGATVNEAGSRSTLYVMALSSTLVAMGFLAESAQWFLPFVATVLPCVFVLGLFTAARLVDTSLEYRQCLNGIARIRAFYRQLPGAGEHFAVRHGRWPETAPPAAQAGPFLAFMSTSGAMVAALNNGIPGVVAALVVHSRLAGPLWVAVLAGIAVTVGLTWVFLRYQHWRFTAFEGGNPDQPTQAG